MTEQEAMKNFSNCVTGSVIEYRTMSKLLIGTLLVASMILSTACPQGKAANQVRANDFPSVRGYDPGYPIPYDPNDPYVALKYLNEQFDGVWADTDSGNLDVTKYFSRAPQDEDYTDPNR